MWDDYIFPALLILGTVVLAVVGVISFLIVSIIEVALATLSMPVVLCSAIAKRIDGSDK